MKYRALILDVDGTLVCAERRQPSAACVQALQGLQRRGVAVIIATGRGAFLSTPQLLGGLQPDYRVCANGGHIVDCEGNTLHEDKLDAEQVETLSAFARENGYRLTFTFNDGYYAYTGYESYLGVYTSGNMPPYIKDGSEGDRHRDSLPYGAFCIMPREATERYGPAARGLKMMESMPGAYDVCLHSAGKSVGIARLLNRLGLTWPQVVAVGDGENDMDMLEHAGLGVAMGNARDDVKAVADLVVASAQEDGVLEVVQRFFTAP